MPRYYFHTHNGDVSQADREGYVLLDAKAAREAAIEALPDMARDVLPDGDHRTFRVTVEDERGKIIYEAALELTGQWRIPPPV